MQPTRADTWRRVTIAHRKRGRHEGFAREGRVKDIRKFVGKEMSWVQPRAMKKDFELQSGDDTIATLRFRSPFGSFATAETADGAWTLKRVGFWNPHLTVRIADTETQVASFKNKTWTDGGTLELANGRFLRANSNFWNTKYEFKDANDEMLIRFVKVGGLLHLSSNVEIMPAGAKLDELPLLVVVGWYLTVTMHSDAAGAAAAAAAAG